jgi:DNA-binding NtrC family response regulator
MTAHTDHASGFIGTPRASSRDMHIPASSRISDPAVHGDGRAAQPAQFITIPISGRSLREIERDVLVVTMRLTAFNYSAAARILGISRPTLYRKLQENGICRQPAP